MFDSIVFLAGEPYEAGSAQLFNSQTIQVHKSTFGCLFSYGQFSLSVLIIIVLKQ
jgi:hypothetical protein